MYYSTYYPSEYFKIQSGKIQRLCPENTILISNTTKRVFRIEKSHEIFEICKDCSFHIEGRHKDCATVLNQNFNLNVKYGCTEVVPRNCIFKELKGGV